MTIQRDIGKINYTPPSRDIGIIEYSREIKEKFKHDTNSIVNSNSLSNSDMKITNLGLLDFHTTMQKYLNAYVFDTGIKNSNSASLNTDNRVNYILKYTGMIIGNLAEPICEGISDVLRLRKEKSLKREGSLMWAQFIGISKGEKLMEKISAKATLLLANKIKNSPLDKNVLAGLVSLKIIDELESYIKNCNNKTTLKDILEKSLSKLDLNKLSKINGLKTIKLKKESTNKINFGF